MTCELDKEDRLELLGLSRSNLIVHDVNGDYKKYQYVIMTRVEYTQPGIYSYFSFANGDSLVKSMESTLDYNLNMVLINVQGSGILCFAEEDPSEFAVLSRMCNDIKSSNVFKFDFEEFLKEHLYGMIIDYYSNYDNEEIYKRLTSKYPTLEKRYDFKQIIADSKDRMKRISNNILQKIQSK